jgi:uncharacterized protein YyaL (SSP411 family)
MNPASIPWLQWSTDAFQQAQAGGRPVLLSIVARWSAACRAMETEVFATPAVVAAVQAHAVPIRVDADQRPDIADRYGLGGWPTTVWLTPDGEMLRGGTYLDADTLATALVDVASRFARDRVALVQQAAAARTRRQRARDDPTRSSASSSSSLGPAPLPSLAAASRAAQLPSTLDTIRDCILREFDPDEGGFGREAKFPLAAPILFALRAGVLAPDAELIVVAETTLDRMAQSALSDAHDGAFHRACGNRDWTGADPARLLDVQAEMIDTYLESWRLLHHDRHRTRAIAALEYVHRTLREREGARAAWHPGGPAARAFYHDEFEPDHHAHHADLSPASTHSHPQRRDAFEPDPLIVVESNARMMRALTHASQTLDDRRWILAAVEVAERLLPIVYVRASGIAHYIANERPFVFGLLADSIQMASALLDLGDAAGQGVYVDLASELAHSCVRRFWDAAAGGFVDRIRTTAGAGDVGLLGEPLKPYVVNVEAARLLARLAARTGDTSLATRAREAARYVASVSARQGILSSEYGLLLLELGQNNL